MMEIKYGEPKDPRQRKLWEAMGKPHAWHIGTLEDRVIELYEKVQELERNLDAAPKE